MHARRESGLRRLPRRGTGPERSGLCRQSGVSFRVSLTFTRAAPDTPPMSARGHKFGLLLSVTLAGMAVLIIEITAIRMLAPFFGNSIFTISSVIGIILAALGLGYYLGGSLADRKPSAAWFFSLIVIAGFSVLLLQFLNAVLLPGIAYTLSLIDGPLIVSFLMFFLPAMLLATRRLRKILPVGLALLCLIAGIALGHAGTADGPSVVFAADGLYEKIVI